jgi:arylsulfatase A-like enzyme
LGVPSPTAIEDPIQPEPSMKRAFVLALRIAACGPIATAGAEEPSRPNILLILADDLGYGDLGCYGQRRIRTPHLDGLAAQGVRFTRCYAGSTVCAPSRSALMEGLHTGHARFRGNARVPRRPEDLAVAEVLRGVGYATGLVGKWGLGGSGTTGVPNRQGFDAFFGFLDQHYAHNYYFPRLPLVGRAAGAARERRGPGRHRHAPGAVRARPVHPRGDRVPRSASRQAVLPLPGHDAAARQQRAGPGHGMEVPSDAPYSEEPWPKRRRDHAAMITRLDADVGKVLQRLADLGLEQETIVFFSSDNGPHQEGGAEPAFFWSAGPLRGHKRPVRGWRPGADVRPLDRAHRRQSGQRPGLVFWDFLPTAAELAGTESPEGRDWLSMVPALLGPDHAGREQPEHDALYWEFHEGGFHQAARIGGLEGHPAWAGRAPGAVRLED